MAEFKPNADYSWQNETNFEITGKEFEILHNTLSTIFNSNVSDSQMYIMLYKLLEISSSVLKRNVESDKIVEVIKDAQEAEIVS